MTWDAFHRRGEVLRAVVDEANTRRDGILPMQLPGVAETFGDELTLIGALQLRWHTRLAGLIERELMDHPGDLEPAVLSAWCRAASELAGVRAILDAYTEAPTSEAMARALDTAHRKDWALLAAMAGRAGVHDERAAEVGRKLEEGARVAHRRVTGDRSGSERTARRVRRESLLGRLRAHLAA